MLFLLLLLLLLCVWGRLFYSSELETQEHAQRFSTLFFSKNPNLRWQTGRYHHCDSINQYPIFLKNKKKELARK
jgi:hypothetical protein